MNNLDPELSNLTESGLPIGFAGNWPLQVRDFLARHLESIFVIVVTLTVVAVFYFCPYKIAFLNLFYLPVLTACFFMGKRQAMLGAALCVLSGVLFAYYRPDWFEVTGTRLNSLLVLATWGGFLILATATIGSLQERLKSGFEKTNRLYEELKRSRNAEEIKEKVEKVLYATMDPVVAKLATEGKLRFEKRDISIMFMDLTNFTTYMEKKPPDVVLDDLNRFFSEVEGVVEPFRGHIDKYMGDGVMLEFGAPVEYDRHALLAALAGWKLQQKIKTWDMPWRLRVGIASGGTIVGMFGNRRQAYSAIGDRVNVAKRLEEHCQPDKVYIDENTYKAIEPFMLATRLRYVGIGREADRDLLERVSLLEDKLDQEGESADLLFELGKLNFDLRDAAVAIRYYERALALEPSANHIKIAYADANIKKDEYEKIQLKGKLQKVTVYDLLGTKDRWGDPSLIPPYLVEKYRDVEAHIGMPDDVVLPVEALDGSVGHSRLVALLSYAIADRLNLNEELKKTILRAGYLQDIGKEAVSHRTLNRQGGLSAEEVRLVVERYVQESVAACKRIGYVDPQLLEIVAHHHDSWNGTGLYNLKGEEIPIGSRITGVAEAYSAMTSWRPYREAWDSRVAVSEIRKAAEKEKYDPKVVDAMVEILAPNN